MRHADHTTLPPKPEPPKDYDCCGGGCADCDLQIYLRELAAWKKLEAALQNPHHDRAQKPVA